MRVFIIPLFVLFLYIGSPSATANFGFGPCCPPSTCGIIPCDSGCAGAAISQMGTAVSSALNSLNSAYQDLSSGVQDTISSTNDLGVDVSDSLTQQNGDLLDALSASTNKIELANVLASKALERNTDHMNISFVNALKEIEVARASSDNIETFGDFAQPVNGESSPGQARAIKTITTQMKQVTETSTLDFIRYLSDEHNTAAGAGTNQHRMQSLTALDSFDRLYSLLTESTLDEADFQNLQTVIGIATAKYSLAEHSQPNGSEYEISKMRHIAMLAMAYHALLLPASSRMGLDNASWATYYQNVDLNEEGNVGLIGLYHAEVIGKITDPEWWGATLRLNEAGLEREKVYQSALSAQLKNHLGTISASSNELLSILLAKKTDYKIKELNETFEQL